MTSHSAASFSSVSKAFGTTPALRDVSFEVSVGEVVALLGPNGAGKTTAISLLLGLRRPDAGRARVFGEDPGRAATRRMIGVTPQEMAFPQRLRVGEVLDFVRAHYPRPTPRAELIASFGLDDVLARQTGGLSGGQKRRLAVALAFAVGARAIILDEPTTGMDVTARRQLWEAIRAYAQQGGTALLTTHYLEEAEALADRIALIDRGRIRLEGTVSEIKALAGYKRVRFRASRAPDLPGVAKLEKDGECISLFTTDSDGLVRALVDSGAEFADLEVQPVSLEDAFIRLTEGDP